MRRRRCHVGRGGRSVAGRMGKAGSAGERRDGRGHCARPRALRPGPRRPGAPAALGLPRPRPASRLPGPRTPQGGPRAGERPFSAILEACGLRGPRVRPAPDDVMPPTGFSALEEGPGAGQTRGFPGRSLAERVVHSFINWAHANGALPSAWCARSTDLARTRGGEAEVRMGRWLSCCARTPRRREETVRAGQGVLSREVASSLMAP